jgi:hypothetical protein
LDWIIFIGVIGLVCWFMYRREIPSSLAPHIMAKWVEVCRIASASAGNGASAVGQSVIVHDFRYEIQGVAPMLKVAVFGSGAHLGFREDLMDDGQAVVWAENGSPRAARRLVKALCAAYPELIDGNKFNATVRGFIHHFGPK